MASLDPLINDASRNKGAYEQIHQMASDLIEITFLFLSRADGSEPERIASLKKALANFKVRPEMGNVDEVIRLFKIKHFTD